MIDFYWLVTSWQLVLSNLKELWHKIYPNFSSADLPTLTVWGAILQSYGFASKSHGEPENLEIAKKFHKVWRNIE